MPGWQGLGVMRAGDWSFWRKAFWTRPALLAAYSVLCFLAGLGVFAAAVAAFQDSRGMAEAELCGGLVREGAEGADCLFPVTGRLDGPQYSRGPGSDWDFRELGQDESQEREVQVGTVGSRQLGEIAGEEVTGRLWHGELVGFVVAGEVVESDEYGARPWVLRTLIGLALLGGGLMLSNAVSQKRRNGSGWLSADARPVGVMPLTSWRMAVGTVLAMPALLAVLPLAVGLPTWTIGATFILAMVWALVVTVLKGRDGGASATRPQRGAARAAQRRQQRSGHGR